MKNTGNVPGERLAELMAGIFHKIQHGRITVDELELFAQRKNPFAFEFERNEHGHIVLTITGLALTGAEEIERHLASPDGKMTGLAKSCLLSQNDEDYDRNHRLIEGQTYKVALMPTSVIGIVRELTAEALREHGASNFGYDKGLAGLIPRIREEVSNQEMEDMGFRYIAGLHDLIMGEVGGPSVLCLGRSGYERWFGAHSGAPDICWSDKGAVAMLLPTS